MAKADPMAFNRLLGKRGVTKAELARTTGIRRNTIQSIAKGNPCHSSNLEKIAKALGSEVEELCGGRKARGEEELREESRKIGIHRLNITLSSRMVLNYQLVADRYNMTTNEIIQAAPLCFTLLAELSLKRRREANTRLVSAMHDSAKGFEHSPLVNKVKSLLDVESIWEFASINARDLEGRLADPDCESNSEGAFTAFMRNLADETGIPEVEDFGDDAFGFLSQYSLFGEHLKIITGGSRRARFALDKRHTTIQFIPKDLRWVEGETEDVASRRVVWLENQVPETVWQEEDARWSTLLAKLDLDDLPPTPADGGSNA